MASFVLPDTVPHSVDSTVYLTVLLMVSFTVYINDTSGTVMLITLLPLYAIQSQFICAVVRFVHTVVNTSTVVSVISMIYTVDLGKLIELDGTLCNIVIAISLLLYELI